jgi:hypothetical protein
VPVPVYSERLNVVVRTPLHDAITTAAHASLQSVNSFVRGACIERLRREGFAPCPGRPPDVFSAHRDFACAWAAGARGTAAGSVSGWPPSTPLGAQ